MDTERVALVLLRALRMASVPYGVLRGRHDVTTELVTMGIVPEELAQLSDSELDQRFHGCFAGDQRTGEFWTAAVLCRFDREFQVLGNDVRAGAFGSVRRCLSKIDNAVYAVKTVDIPCGAASKAIERVLREVTSLACLNHANVTRYYHAWMETLDDTKTPNSSPEKKLPPVQDGDSAADSFIKRYAQEWDASTLGEGMESLVEVESVVEVGSFLPPAINQPAAAPAVGKRLYIVMEYVHDKLSEYINDEDLHKTLDRVAVLRQLLSGLEHIHGMGLIHRDIAPKNVLLDARHNVKIADFGLCKAVNVTSSSATGRDTGILGTPFYIAPEVTRGCCADTKADMFSLGVLTVELFVYLDAPAKSTFFNTLTLPTSLEPAIATLVSRLLDEDPEKRPSAAEALKELDNGLDELNNGKMVQQQQASRCSSHVTVPSVPHVPAA